MRPPDARDAERAKPAIVGGVSDSPARSAPWPGARSVLGSRIESPEERGAEPKRENFLTLPRCDRPRYVD